MAAPTGTSRAAILAVLRRGEITSPEGRAISTLGGAAGYQGTLSGLSALVARMEADGELRVERRGPKPVRIWLGPNA